MRYTKTHTNRNELADLGLSASVTDLKALLALAAFLPMLQQLHLLIKTLQRSDLYVLVRNYT